MVLTGRETGGERRERGGGGGGSVVCEISTMLDHRQRRPGECHLSLQPLSGTSLEHLTVLCIYQKQSCIIIISTYLSVVSLQKPVH